MISPHNSNIVAAFFMDGVHEAWDNWQGREPLEIWNRGFYELVYDLTQYAEYCYQLGEAGGKICDFPGVYDYEVSTVFGRWWAEYTLKGRGAPSRVLCRVWLLDAAQKFFKDGDESPNDELDEALMGVAL